MPRNLGYLLVILGCFSCSAPAPQTGCRDDTECGGGQECRQGQCVPKGSVGCSTDSDCAAAVTAQTLTAPGACEDLKCGSDGFCTKPPKAVGVACTGTETANCLTNACDGAGACAATVTSGCFVDATCVKAGALKTGNSCESCDPNHPTVWTPAPDDANVTCTEGVGACQFGVCISGTCAPQAKDGGACEDGSVCTVGDVCANGVCKAGAAKDCDDKDVCTDDSCDKTAGCKHAKNSSACDDGIACTLGDTCGASGCAGLANDATCADSSVCTDDTCDVKSKGCLHANNTAACDDGDACTLGDTCAGGACGSGTAKDCDDKNPCTLDTCAKGACGHANLPDQATCTDDGLACTADVCLTGSCSHPVSADSCLINGACQASGGLSGDGCLTCNPALDKQNWSSQPVGTACQKGEACQVGTCTALQVCNVTGTAPGFCFIGQVCVAHGDLNPANSCELCNAANQGSWSIAVDATPCATDNVACTDDRCASGTCTHIANPTLCAAKTGACTLGVCDLQNGCVAVPSDVTAPCNSDGNVCTLEHCGNKTGACEATSAQLNCDDGVACTLDSCDPTSGCGHVTQSASCDDGNVCTADVCDAKLDCQHSAVGGSCALPGDVSCSADTCVAGACQAGAVASTCIIGGGCITSGALTAEGCEVCDPGKNVFGWSNSADGTACSDGKACHVNQCASGACDHGLAGGWCEIAGACQPASAAKSDNACLVCKPSSAVGDWSPAANGTTCASDSIACTADQCDSVGVCQHAATDSLCAPTPATCAVPLCKPSDSGADPATGCVPVDDCPVGHHCDATANACLTDAPIAIVTAGGDHPNPTNPALIRHVLDDKTGTTRTWVVFQTDTCATAANSQWSISKPAGLRAAIVDSIVGTPASKATLALAPVPVVALPAATGWADATTVCQGYPAVARDPLATNLGWLSWLESAPGQTSACLTANGQGGLLRLARLDGAGLPAGGVWSAVAGDAASLAGSALCTANDAFLPSFLTAGFGILPVAGTDAASKGLVSVRPNAGTLNSLGSTELLRAGSAGENQNTTTNPITGSFSQVHPVVLDMGTLETERFFGVGMTQKLAAGTTTHALWAVPISSAGVDDSPVEWSKGTTPASGAGTGDLAGITAVCGMDASVDAGGNVGVALVVRRAGKDTVLLVTRAPGAATGVVTVVKEQASADPGCAIGLSAVRIVGRASGDFVVEWLQSAGPTDVALGGIWLTSTASNTPVQLATLTAWDTDGSGAPLAWRGLGGIAVGTGGVVTTVIEGRAGTSRALFLHSLKL